MKQQRQQQQRHLRQQCCCRKCNVQASTRCSPCGRYEVGIVLFVFKLSHLSEPTSLSCYVGIRPGASTLTANTGPGRSSEDAASQRRQG